MSVQISDYVVRIPNPPGGAVQTVATLAEIGETLGWDSAFSEENKDVGSIFAGAPVAPHSSGTGAVLATAAAPVKPAVGLATGVAAVGYPVTVQTAGQFTLSDWTAVTGSVTLDPLARYFLDTAVGKLTVSPTSVVGNINQLIGLSLNPSTLELVLDSPVHL